MKAFLTPLQGLAEFEQICEKGKKNKGVLQVSGCLESQKAHLIYGLCQLAPFRLILAEDERRAREIYEDYRFYDKKIYLYPARDLLFFQADIHGNLLIRQRMQVVRALMEEKELAVVTSIDGCMDFLESLEQIREQLLHFTSDSTVNIDALKARLVWLGYERVGQVEMPGQFSIRGGIVDIYCLTEENGEMRLILSAALTQRASVLWKIWKKSQFILLWSIRGRRPSFLFWIIFLPRNL